MLRVLIAGVTGWTGAPLAEAVRAADDLELAGGIARSGADHASVEEALAAGGADVLVDYTKPGVVRGHVDAALAAGLHVVVGTSGLTGADYAEIDAAARAAGRGVIAAGNFSVFAATLMHAGISKPFRIVGIPDEETVPGSQADIFRHYGISMEGLSETALKLLK